MPKFDCRLAERLCCPVRTAPTCLAALKLIATSTIRPAALLASEPSEYVPRPSAVSGPYRDLNSRLRLVCATSRSPARADIPSKAGITAQCRCSRYKVPRYTFPPAFFCQHIRHLAAWSRLRFKESAHGNPSDTTTSDFCCW